ncbi:NPCBM/NEW2 domain-containing protein [Sphingobacterium sp. UDSM-2020]|uniref:NPCBM/NEW2 domain-containing protein n=1 Tax=Sphingobacterium sp. UDSM-2020 TaxID=2795738 RepID=UPI00193790AE|nr:NPCBM/NEW2 domain-containing protein [Sphingobacterium sp. UDSM-2020]QQD16156.1 NPCBM/NEW2 domain-containing protein [Sphingobacterium sp. UDSM-2020]
MLKTILLISAGLLIGQSLFAQESIKLKDLDLSHAWQEYGILQKGRSVTGEPVTINGTVYDDVLGVQAKSIIKIKLEKNATRFVAQVGIAESTIDVKDKSLTIIPLVDGTKLHFIEKQGQKQFVGVTKSNPVLEKGSVKFTLKGDGKPIFVSSVIKGGDRPQQIDVPLKDVMYLELVAETTDDGPSGDHAVWIAPKIDYKTIKPQLVDVGIVGPGANMDARISKKLAAKIKALPLMKQLSSDKTAFDWLITPQKSKAGIYTSADGKNIIIANAMVSRTFRIFPNLATVDITNRMLGESLIRAVSSEGTIQIDGKKWNIGGLNGQEERGYLKNEWLDKMTTLPESFMVEDFEIKPLEERIKWARNRWALNKEPVSGQQLVFTLRGERELKDVKVKLYFSIYDHIPVISKRMEVINESTLPINIDFFQLEYLAFSEPESPGDGDPSVFRLPNIHVESDFAAGGAFTEKTTDITEKWVTDPAYTSQRNYLLETPCVLDVSPKLGPNYSLESKGTFQSFTVHEMPFDSDDRERKGLFTRKMYRTIAPWTSENPIFMHLTSTDPEVVHRAIDQCDSTGYEMIILSFGSGLNAEDISDSNIAKFKGFVDYARSKGIDMGCYSLLASRWISDEVDVINPETGKRGGMRFGSSPCLASDWGYEYFEKIKYFFEKTGMKCFEHDGSYPGDFCASTTHAHHDGLADSQWKQFHKVTELYHWMSSQGIYMNVPDFYFLNGSNKVGIGYREANWSLPRDRQLMHARQLNYDCTWDRIPSSLWSFVPLVEYQGGGKDATLEPLNDYLHEYKMHMIQNYGAGVQACYRGPRLYDTPKTKEMVVDVIKWYKRYRNILNSDIIHLRKPDARDWDGMMHVNPDEKEKAFALFYNPTDKEIVRKIQIPLYYTGLSTTAKIREQEGNLISYKLNRDYTVELTVKIPANGYTWYVVE